MRLACSLLRSRCNPPSRRRRGISLLECLISMFVLMVGLLGVAAMIPAGRFELVQAAKMDNAAMVGREAFREIKVRQYWDSSSKIARSYLDPTNWIDAGGASAATNPFVVMDPLGCNSSFTATFPYGASAPLFLTRIAPFTPASNSAQVFDQIFRASDDLITTAPANSSREAAPTQQLLSSSRRGSDGNYSWFATMVPDPIIGSSNAEMVVSVAVSYKRNLGTGGAGETFTRAVAFPAIDFSQPGHGTVAYGGGEVVLDFTNPGTPPNQMKPLKPGQWVMLAGTRTIGGTNYNYFRWYRVVAADNVASVTPTPPLFFLPSSVTAYQCVTLAGPDWSALPPGATGAVLNPPYANTDCPFVWVFDNVIAVYEKNMRLDIP